MKHLADSPPIATSIFKKEPPVSIANFDDLLNAARQQEQPQRLLFVFVTTELPDDATPEQRKNFEANQGGALAPIMFADKSPNDISGFADLLQESEQFKHNWRIVFVSSLSGIVGNEPSAPAINHWLEIMVANVKAGLLGGYIPFDRDGEIIVIE